ncbi:MULTISPECIES: Y-family DNA polymerase [Dyella]|uniref:DNA polymerase Y family protein n=2 Tax=Dyella TaxID=231454 RepID=A0A4R0YU14_9GAMM|nr:MULTISPECIES: DNA polymerase Y family protein [Dyella]TBR40488.1 DNA polymerase Y family protein [Dyella terrae]TCI11931.1 DNA polymerase Y family protein [Dyella soli]
MLWACVLLPQLAMDGVLRRRESADEPLALVTGNAQSRSILAVNASARAAGLRPGQRLAAAQALLTHFEVQQHDPAATTHWHRLLAAWAYRYSAEVALWPHAIVLEVSKSLGLFGPWPDFERKLRDDLRALGFRHRITLAPTPRAAYVLAGLHDGLAVMSPEVLHSALASVPVHKARLPDGAADGLLGMGLRTLGALMRAPRDGLRRRFGAALLDHLDHLTGTNQEILELYRPPDRLDLSMEWTHEIAHVEALVFPLRRLTGDLATCLAGRDGGVQRFMVRLIHRDGTSTDVSIGLLTPERDPAMLFEHTRSRMERITLSQPVVAMRLVAHELPPFVPVGRDLFDTRPAHALPLEQIRERLRSRLGDSAIARWQATTDPRPEHAQSTARDIVVIGKPPALPRPSWLLDHPIPLRGPPPQIVAGPERLETGWWDGSDVRRDYYVVETAQGQRAWVFCAPGERGHWMLQGWFA